MTACLICHGHTFTSVQSAVSTEGVLSFLALINKGDTDMTHTHTHTDILFVKLLNSPPETQEGSGGVRGRGEF